MIRFEIPFRLPSLNEYIYECRGNRFGGGKLKKATDYQIMWCIKNVKQKVDKPVFIKFIWCEPNKKRDKDNVAFAKKFILDALQKSGILPNDNNQYVTGFMDVFIYGKESKVIVEIKTA